MSKHPGFTKHATSTSAPRGKALPVPSPSSHTLLVPFQVLDASDLKDVAIRSRNGLRPNIDLTRAAANLSDGFMIALNHAGAGAAVPARDARLSFLTQVNQRADLLLETLGIAAKSPDEFARPSQQHWFKQIFQAGLFGGDPFPFEWMSVPPGKATNCLQDAVRAAVGRTERIAELEELEASPEEKLAAQHRAAAIQVLLLVPVALRTLRAAASRGVTANQESPKRAGRRPDDFQTVLWQQLARAHLAMFGTIKTRNAEMDRLVKGPPVVWAKTIIARAASNMEQRAGEWPPGCIDAIRRAGRLNPASIVDALEKARAAINRPGRLHPRK